MLSTTKTDIAKMAVSMTLSIVVRKRVKQELELRTSLDPDTIVVQVGAAVAGDLVAIALKSYTDKSVDFAIGFTKSLTNRNSK